MKKFLIILVAILLMCVAGGFSQAQDSQYKILILSGTADTIIDSSLTTAIMNNKRLYINGIYWWYDNAANTNQMFVEVVRGQSAMATAGAGRQFKYSEAMTSNGIKGTSLPVNITTGTDSTLYFEISGASSDSLFMAVSYKFVGN